ISHRQRDRQWKRSLNGTAQDTVVLSSQDVGTKSCPASGRIVARFAAEGKPGPVKKSLIFDCVEPPLWRGLRRGLHAIRVTAGLVGGVVVGGGGRGRIGTGREDRFFCARRDFHDKRQRCPIRCRRPAPTQRIGAIYQGFVLRESECAVVAGTPTDPAPDQHSDQCGGQQPRRKRI